MDLRNNDCNEKPARRAAEEAENCSSSIDRSDRSGRSAQQLREKSLELSENQNKTTRFRLERRRVSQVVRGGQVLDFQVEKKTSCPILRHDIAVS